MFVDYYLRWITRLSVVMISPTCVRQIVKQVSVLSKRNRSSDDGQNLLAFEEAAADEEEEDDEEEVDEEEDDEEEVDEEEDDEEEDDEDDKDEGDKRRSQSEGAFNFRLVVRHCLHLSHYCFCMCSRRAATSHATRTAVVETRP
jgi:hypothetical protein